MASPHVPPSADCILTVNGGSSTIKFAVFAPSKESGLPPQRLFDGLVDRIGLPGTSISAKFTDGRPAERREMAASTEEQAADQLIQWLAQQVDIASLRGVGHRVVHGGAQLVEHQMIDDRVMAELKRIQPLDLSHLPGEIALIEALRRGFESVPQIACFDTAFHRDLPRVAKLLPIPRKYDAAGVRRFGFHGLSYSYLMDELARIAGRDAAHGRVILAHLGSGASMAAVRGGKPIDTSMAFTPTAGLVMGSRPGDLDPGLLVYLMREENLTPQQMDDFLSKRCGLIGISQTTYDMRDLLARRASDVRAAEAVDLFCYQAKKFIGAYAAAMGGLDTLVFSGGIGEHASEVRAGICDGLEFLGVRIDPQRNATSDAVISTDESRGVARVIPTDEELVIAQTVKRLVGNHGY
jgi:acetate kinase